ncbi:MAG: hypothetical protein COB65_01370 [Thalassobium sp.]|nr:MAG: hypothetical protein COB65_01370 [Thalassobium sp.]
MRNAGISLQAIRFAISLAQEKFGIDKPLSSREFKTDGSQILMHAIENDGELVSLSKKYPGQKVFAKIVLPSLKNLEYDDGHVARWRPAQTKDIVIDPKRLFGAPVLDDFGVSTSMLFEEHKDYGDIGYLSRVYEIPRKLILHAIRYEQALDESSGQSTI